MASRRDQDGAVGDLLTAQGVARMLNLSRQHVYTMAASGELPSIKLKGAVRFDPADVDRFIREHRRKSA